MATTIKRTTIIERGIRTKSKSPAATVKQRLNTFLDNSTADKVELGRLNDRLSTYLNKVKSLETENSTLMREIYDMQSSWGELTRQVREQYEQNLFDSRGRIDDVAHLKTIAEIRTKRADYEKDQNELLMSDLVRAGENDREKMEELERRLVNLTQTNQDLRKAFENEATDIEHLKITRDNTWANLMNVLDDLDNELLRRISIEYNNQTLREHIEFIKQVNERELIEMEQLGKVLPFNEQVEFYKDQLKKVVSSIRRDYSNINAEQSREMEEWMTKKKEELAILYSEKDPLTDLKLSMELDQVNLLNESLNAESRELNELRREHEAKIKRLQSLEEHLDVERLHINNVIDEKNQETSRLNEALTNLLNDYNHLNTNKATLEYELQVYKRLLELNTN